jgi:methionyl-tRNA formyltransferase
MNVLILGLANNTLASILKEYGNQILEIEFRIDVQFLKENKIDFAVSYGYRHIIKSDVLNHLKDRIINLHISYLPWNKGADPNLWSFLENTPKGVTIHYMDEGLDTGDIIAQKVVEFDEESETLRTTYNKLSEEIVILFKETWPLIANGQIIRRKQIGKGSYHSLSDKDRFKYLLFNGWDTPVKFLQKKT